MSRRNNAGEIWLSAAVDLDVPGDWDLGRTEIEVLQELRRPARYAEALDLLARRVAPALLDCTGGIWERRGR